MAREPTERVKRLTLVACILRNPQRTVSAEGGPGEPIAGPHRDASGPAPTRPASAAA